MDRRAILTVGGSLLVSACVGSGGDDSNGVQDSDDDGVIDSEDYAPNDPEVQERSDLQGTSEATTAIKTTSTTTGTTRTTRQPTTQAETIANETLRVHEDEYQRYTWSLTRSATLSYEFTVREGPSLDVILTSESEFENYKSGDRFQINSEGSSMDSVGDRKQVTLDPRSNGGWVLIVDNSDAGAAEPPSDLQDNVAVVEIAAVIEG